MVKFMWNTKDTAAKATLNNKMSNNSVNKWDREMHKYLSKAEI